jgi:hypothetical protein
MEVPAVVNGRTIGTATFTVTAIETPGGVTATVNFGEKLIGQLGFASGTGFENVMATIRNLLTPLPSLRHS